jgi:acetyl esterase/lipase
MKMRHGRIMPTTDVGIVFKGNAPNPLIMLALHARSLSNLPPLILNLRRIDTLCDEGIAFANRLQKENGSVILNVIKGSYHAFEKEFKRICPIDPQSPR